MFEHFLTKILKTNLDSASAKATADKSAGQTIFLENACPPLEENCPASAFVPPARSEVSGRNAGGFLNLSFFASEFRASETDAPLLIISP